MTNEQKTKHGDVLPVWQSGDTLGGADSRVLLD